MNSEGFSEVITLYVSDTWEEDHPRVRNKHTFRKYSSCAIS